MNPIHVHFGALFYPFYEGFYFSLATLITFLIWDHYVQNHDINHDQYRLLIFFGFLGAIIGGRLVHVLFWNLEYYAEDPVKIVSTWDR